MERTLKVKKGVALQKETRGSAGYDLHSSEYVIIEPGTTQIIDTGVYLAIPAGYVGFVCSRSGLAAKQGAFVLNSPGIIDSDYRGELKVILANFGDGIVTVSPDDRIAQLVIVPVANMPVQFVSMLPFTMRGEGGLGSTGV